MQKESLESFDDPSGFSNVPWRKHAFGPGTKYGCRNMFVHSWGLVYGEGGAPGTEPESHFTCSSPRCAARVVPSTFFLFYHFVGILRGLRRGEGAPLLWYLCKPTGHFTKGMFEKLSLKGT